MSELASKLEKSGWQLQEERAPAVREVVAGKNAAAQVLVTEGYYSATKRHDNGNTLVQFDSDTPEGLCAQIEGWENEQAIATAVPNPKEKAYKESQENSNAATAALASPTGGNKPGE